MASAKILKCPRCNLPQEGILRCQYCGYDLSKNKYTKTFRNRLKDIMGAFNKDRTYTVKKRSTLKDNGGTRSGADRRVYIFSKYYPDKRSGRDRRKGDDRRRKAARKRQSERRFSLMGAKPKPRET